MIMECCESPQKHHGAVFEKYADRRYKRASTFVETEMSKGFMLPPVQVAGPSLPSSGDVASHMLYDNRESFKHIVQIKG